MQIDPQLNPIYTFDSYIEGDCNRVARRAGKTVAEKPVQILSILWLYMEV
jgi:chromosomal replication initiator protein